MSKRKPRPVEHYLITVDLNPIPAHLHSYVMTNDEHNVHRVIDKLFEIADERSYPIRFPIILQTKLTTGSDIVREIVAKQSEDVKNALKTATNFHCSIFMLPTNDTDDQCLMDLH